MAYIHPFLGTHLPDNLLPDWHYDILIIGALQPYTTATGSKMPYYYGNTPNNLFWDLLPEIFSGKKLSDTKEAWVPFLKNSQIGLTDLIISLPTPANITSELFLNSNVHTFSELITSDAVVWNTASILNKIKENKISAVYVIDALASDYFESEVNEIKAAAKSNEIHFGRLPSPSVESGLSFSEQALHYPNLFGSWFEALSPVIQVRVR